MNIKTLSTSRYNSTNSQIFSVEYLVVAGGGGGGGQIGAGGGAGGLRLGSFLLPVGQPTYTVTVGAGGSASGGLGVATNGSNSVFSSTTSTGGGSNLTRPGKEQPEYIK